MNLSPIVLFTHNRPLHTRKTVKALQKNILANKSQLIIYSDGHKDNASKTKVEDVRQYLKTINGFKKITTIEREKNWGLANSIIDGVTQVVHTYGKVIVLEDDMVTSPYFLTYMNEALEKFADDERVISIHGYVYPVTQSLPEAFFLLGADCWGWATWQRGWKFFNRDSRFLLDELKRRKLMHAFDFNGAFSYTKMLEEQSKGANDSWAIRWYASAFLAGKLTLYPGRSLVHNIGNDDSGTHCKNSAQMDTDVSQTPIKLNGINVAPLKESRQAFEAYFLQQKKSLLKGLVNKAYNYSKKMLK